MHKFNPQKNISTIFPYKRAKPPFSRRLLSYEGEIVSDQLSCTYYTNKLCAKYVQFIKKILRP